MEDNHSFKSCSNLRRWRISEDRKKKTRNYKYSGVSLILISFN